MSYEDINFEKSTIEGNDLLRQRKYYIGGRHHDRNIIVKYEPI